MIEKWKRYCVGSGLLAWTTLAEAGIWLIVAMLSLLGKGLHFNPGIAEWLTLPAYFPTYLTRPWTLLTYMWIHFDVLHVLFNLLWLYWFGRILLTTLSDRDLAYYFFGGGICGGIFFLAASAMGLGGGWLCGCSSAVIAVMAGAAIRHPNMEVRLFLIGNVKLKWVAAVCCLLTFLGGGGNQAAHIGGLVWGVVVAVISRESLVISRESLVISRESGVGSRESGVGSRESGVRSREYGVWRRKDEPRRRRVDKVVKAMNDHRDDMARLDELLDKIKSSGYEGLSRKERKELEELSKRIKR